MEERMRSKVTLPKIPEPYRPIFRGEKRSAMIRAVMDQMRDWRLSPFESEASMHHGLRSGLCLDAHGWKRSAIEATMLVGEALRLLGAERPSFAEGQRQYTIPRENCLWCNVPLSEVEGVRPSQRFCSPECARFHLTHRDLEEGERNGAMITAAARLIRSGRLPEIECANPDCGTVFRPYLPDNRYCCKSCAQKAQPRALKRRLCPGCNKTFMPKYSAQKTCSYPCHHRVRVEATKREAALRPCPNCLGYFRPASHNTAFCSQECSREMFNGFRREARRTGGKAARTPAVAAILAAPISSILFDVLWTQHRRTVARASMTTTLFDRLFREAA